MRTLNAIFCLLGFGFLVYLILFVLPPALDRKPPATWDIDGRVSFVNSAVKMNIADVVRACDPAKPGYDNSMHTCAVAAQALHDMPVLELFVVKEPTDQNSNIQQPQDDKNSASKKSTDKLTYSGGSNDELGAPRHSPIVAATNNIFGQMDRTLKGLNRLERQAGMTHENNGAPVPDSGV